MVPDDDLRTLLGDDGTDPARANEVFETYDRFLRKAIRRWLTPDLRRRFDSADVAQSVWAGLLRGGPADRHFPGPEYLRAFLVRAARNRVIDRARHLRAEIAHGPPAGPSRLAELVPGDPAPPSGEAHAAELWERMLANCPPEHREILTLRRDGLTLDEVAARVGLHEGSVRRILRTVARRVAFEPPAGDADGAA